MLKKSLIIQILLICFAPFALFAKDSLVTGSFEMELFDNYNYESDDESKEFNEDYFRAKLNLKNKITKNLYLKSQFRFKELNPYSEQQQREASDKPGNKSFEDEGLYVKKLSLNYKYNNNLLLIGKFTTRFGKSWTRKDNIWLFEKARTKYRQDEKIGIANYIKLGDKKKNGLYNLGIATFTNDNKYLSNSIITKRDVDNDGINPGDSRGLKSYVVSMDIEYDFADNEELSYHFSYLNLDVNRKKSNLEQDKIADMTGYALNMNYKYPILNNVLGEGFIEYVKFNNYEGNQDKNSYFLTTSLSLYFLENYGITIGQYHDKQQEIGQYTKNINAKELSFSYNFSEDSIFRGLRIISGFKKEKIFYSNYKNIDNIFGVRLRYIKLF